MAEVAGALSGPLVARRWLAMELVRLRGTARLRQSDAARPLRCSVARISYIESGERSPSVRELEDVLLPLYRVPEQDWPAYVAAAAVAGERGWWDEWDEDDVPRSLRRYVGLEDGARRLRCYQSVAVPGLLQTPDYARAVMRSIVTYAAADISHHIEFRMTRQAVLSRDVDPLNAEFVLDESALRRQVGGLNILRAQLSHLVDVVESRPNVELRVLPFSTGAHGAFTGPFSILDFGLADDPGLVMVEGISGQTFIESSRGVRLYSEAFARLLEIALDAVESVEMVRSLLTDGVHSA